MNKLPNVHVSLEQAKKLVEYLETGQQDKADDLISEIQNPINSELLLKLVSLRANCMIL